MKAHLFSFLLAAIAIAGAAVSGPSADVRSEAAQIDFSSLHDQATSALQLLRISQERRIAFRETDEASF
jgi:hypothetical protein